MTLGANAEKFPKSVSLKNWIEATNNWNSIVNKSEGQKQWSHFERFIGPLEYDVPNTYNLPQRVNCTERAYDKIQMLLSPHARTLLKAFKIRTGYQKKIP